MALAIHAFSRGWNGFADAHLIGAIQALALFVRVVRVVVRFEVREE